MKRLALLLLLLSITLLNGCAYTGYSLYDDQRLMGTISDDKELSAKIKTALLDESFSGGWRMRLQLARANAAQQRRAPDIAAVVLPDAGQLGQQRSQLLWRGVRVVRRGNGGDIGQSVIGDANFGSQAQTINPLANIQTGAVRLS